MKKIKNQFGFGALELIIVLVVIAGLAFGGYYVWHSQNNKKSSSSNTSSQSTQSSQSTNSTPAADSTADWIAYSDKTGQFSLKYPKTWSKAAKPELCTPGLLLLGGNSKSVGACGSENFGQMMVASAEGNQISKYDYSQYNGSNFKTTSVTVDGVEGKKVSGGYSLTFAGVTEKFNVIVYVFYANGRTYASTYFVDSHFPDVSNDYNTMITKTLKFHS